MTTPPIPSAPPLSPEDLGAWVDLLWTAVESSDEYTAGEVAFTALDAGMDAETFLLDVIAAVQRKVGEEWAANRITVAQEHAATAINERVTGAISYHFAERTAARRGRITVACVDGEWHDLPALLLAEVLRLRGWRVDYLGAQVPTPHLIAHLRLVGADAVALSSSIPTRLPTAHATIGACRTAGFPVLAGGAAFGPDGRYACLLGANFWAPDARSAADRLEREPVAQPGNAHTAVDDLPHLADQEYALVVHSAPQLVGQCLVELEERFPTMRDYTDLQREYTAQDIAHIVDFLAAALYTDDADLFSRFLTWTADVLTARKVPAHSLLPALDALASDLDGSPRAVDLLTQGRRTLTGGHGVSATRPVRD